MTELFFHSLWGMVDRSGVDLDGNPKTLWEIRVDFRDQDGNLYHEVLNFDYDPRYDFNAVGVAQETRRQELEARLNATPVVIEEPIV